MSNAIFIASSNLPSLYISYEEGCSAFIPKLFKTFLKSSIKYSAKESNPSTGDGTFLNGKPKYLLKFFCKSSGKPSITSKSLKTKLNFTSTPTCFRALYIKSWTSGPRIEPMCAKPEGVNISSTKNGLNFPQSIISFATLSAQYILE